MKSAASIVLSLLGVAAAAPAQLRIEGFFGHHVAVAATFGDCWRPRPVPVRYAPPVCYAPPRGHWETVCEQVLVPGYWRQECAPARYGWVRDHCGRAVWGVIEPEHTARIWVPASYRTERHRVWVAGC
jgi:hypothetical protein